MRQGLEELLISTPGARTAPGLGIRRRVSREVRSRTSASRAWPAARVRPLAVKHEHGVSPVPREGSCPAAAPGEASLTTKAQAEVRSFAVRSQNRTPEGGTREAGGTSSPQRAPGASVLAIGARAAA
jgi:hypothetical protein